MVANPVSAARRQPALSITAACAILFRMMNLYSDDAIAGMHEAALTALEELGMKILLPEARQIYRAGGARVDDAEEMVWIGREMVEAALASAPKSIPCRAARPIAMCC